MFEKVNPAHPDKIADRIAGAIVDLAYSMKDDPKIAVEVMIGHSQCYVMIESDLRLSRWKIGEITERLAGIPCPEVMIVQQDRNLAKNQKDGFRCGDNGIFKGMPITDEERRLTDIAQIIYAKYPTDGKYLITDGDLITVCQSWADEAELLDIVGPPAIINPLGPWEGGPNVDVGCTNRKIGSDMGEAATGGGLHGKDLSKADVSVNIFAHILAQNTGKPVKLSCSIGDEYIFGIPYEDIVEIARGYIENIGGFEKFAEWGLIR